MRDTSAKATNADGAVIPILSVTPDLPVNIEGNFKEIETYLKRREHEIATLKLTAKNIDLVKAIKSEAVTYRRRAEEIVKDTMRRLFKDPEHVLKAKVQPIFDLIASIEGRVDAVLSKQEEERVSMMRQVLDDYHVKFQSKYQLTESFLSRVEYKKQYYNKTAVEKETKDDLEGQFILLKKEQDAYAASVRLIANTCSADARLSAAMYIEMLEREDTASIIERIETEKKRLASIDTPPMATATLGGAAENNPVTETEKVVLGVMCNIDFSTDFPGRVKKATKEITYPCDMGDALNELFKRLEQYGVKVRNVKSKEAV